MLLESLIHNKTLKHLNVEKNHIRKVSEMRLGKSSNMETALRGIASSFVYFRELTSVESLGIASWVFDHMEYPDEISKDVKDVEPFFLPKVASHSKEVKLPVS